MPVGQFWRRGESVARLVANRVLVHRLYSAMHLPAGRTGLILTRLDERESDRIHADRSGRFEQRQSQQRRKDNRWADILTFDHSLLPGDYINAALIPPFPGGTATRSYIASQAPLPHTLTAFYRHAIEQGVRLIVNLTPFEERGRTKADPYWPATFGERLHTEPKESGFEVQQAKEAVHLDGPLRATSYEIAVAEGQGTAHTFNVLHVKGWADFGDFPEHVFQTLLELIENEKCVKANTQAPIWVHCSAGVGRSGTVIASMLARDLGASLQSVFHVGLTSTPASVMEAALRITHDLIDHTRQYRPRMVQTTDQVAMVANVVVRLLQSSP